VPNQARCPAKIQVASQARNPAGNQVLHRQHPCQPCIRAGSQAGAQALDRVANPVKSQAPVPVRSLTPSLVLVQARNPVRCLASRQVNGRASIRASVLVRNRLVNRALIQVRSRAENRALYRAKSRVRDQFYSRVRSRASSPVRVLMLIQARNHPLFQAIGPR